MLSVVDTTSEGRNDEDVYRKSFEGTKPTICNMMKFCIFIVKEGAINIFIFIRCIIAIIRLTLFRRVAIK